MSQKYYQVFLAYWSLGADRSLEKLYQDWTKIIPKKWRDKKPKTITTLKNWSVKYSWQELIKIMDQEANRQLYEQAVAEARKTRIDIMKIFRAVVLKYSLQLKDRTGLEISSGDVANFWKMARIEMGLPIDHSKQEHELGQNLAELVKRELKEGTDEKKATYKNQK